MFPEFPVITTEHEYGSPGLRRKVEMETTKVNTCSLIILGTFWFFFSTLRCFYILWGTSRYFEVLLNKRLNMTPGDNVAVDKLGIAFNSDERK